MMTHLKRCILFVIIIFFYLYNLLLHYIVYRLFSSGILATV